MPYQIQANRNLVRVTYTGHVTDAEVLQCATELGELRTGYDQPPNQLMDFSGIEMQDTRYELLLPIGAKLRKQTFARAFRYAMVARTPLSYGIARMFQTLISHPQIDVRIFSTVGEAEHWLAEDAGTSGPMAPAG
jgi:hypothetical protein